MSITHLLVRDTLPKLRIKFDWSLNFEHLASGVNPRIEPNVGGVQLSMKFGAGDEPRTRNFQLGTDAIDTRQRADVRTIHFNDWSVARPGKTKSKGGSAPLGYVIPGLRSLRSLTLD
jgi:hypothetical protein